MSIIAERTCSKHDAVCAAIISTIVVNGDRLVIFFENRGHNLVDEFHCDMRIER
jgi:hypothetical protein